MIIIYYYYYFITCKIGLITGYKMEKVIIYSIVMIYRYFVL